MAIKLKRNGILYVISAPSGGGKSTVLKKLLSADPQIEYSVSVTTRPMREGEINGKSYFFVTREKFEEMIKEGKFLEWASVHGYLYGTRKDIIEQALLKRKDIALDIDFQGGLNIKRQLPESVLIFLLPPSMKILEERLRGRHSDSPETISLRLKNAREEISHSKEYDYILINDELDTTVTLVQSIIEAERSRTSRLSYEFIDP